MEHIYPAFERGRIMKKELLWALRDYSYAALQVRYQDYPDGIISGCRVRAEDGMLHISPGTVKCRDFIFLLAGGERVAYAPTQGYVSLKFRLTAKEELADYTLYRSEFALDGRLERGEGEIELCRFQLKEGARLRTDYRDFYDIQTEYDTVNLAYATWSAAGGSTLSKDVTDFFARKILECGNAPEGDVRFAYFLLDGREAVSYRVLEDYIARRTGEKPGKDADLPDTGEAFRRLEGILEEIRSGNGMRGTGPAGMDGRMIIWD